MNTTRVQQTRREIPLARPDITARERQAVMRVLDTPFLSLGPELPAFEEELAQCAGVPYAVAVNSGTSALHLAMAALGVGPGDEVVTTPFSFVASANCILFQGATPVFADIDPNTLALDPAKVEERITPRTRAIIGVDVFGHPADWDALDLLAKKHSLALVEDAAESIGARYRGRPAGSFGDASVFAFYPNKQITTGEGGVLLTRRKHVADLAASLRNQGRGAAGAWLHHERLGYNYRISDINCALGRAQLSRLDEILGARQRVAERYNAVLANVPGVRTPFLADDVRMSWFVYVVRLSEDYNRTHRDQVIQSLRNAGIGCNDYFPSIHLEPFYRAGWGFKEGDFPTAESVSARTIALPFFGALTDSDVDYVAARLDAALRAL